MYKRIRELREDADLTQVAMGDYLNISHRTYSHYENGTRAVPTDILIKIADFHGVSIDFILERTNVKTMNKG